MRKEILIRLIFNILFLVEAKLKQLVFLYTGRPDIVYIRRTIIMEKGIFMVNNADE